MKCEKCGKNEATTYYQETINGVTREMHLCSDCAAKEHIGASFESFGKQFGSFWNDPFPSFFGGSSLWGDLLSSPAATMLGSEKTCPTCGMTESELRKTGRAGCPDCYETFAALLNPYIRKVQGADRHIGAAPAAEAPTADPIIALKAQLQDAIQKEDYEQAAHLRDEIRRLESEQK